MFRASEVRKALGRPVSRQHVTAILRQLVSGGLLVRAGTTKGAIYALPGKAERLRPVVRRRLINRTLHEDEVFDEVKKAAPFIERLRRNVREIYAYAFLEMLNNAIEHSRSDVIKVAVSTDNGTASFDVDDYGIGVFRNVMQQRQLASELEAMQDLLKGKATTQPQAHSGEGIFFTSKTADEFILESFGHRLRVDNRINDYSIERPRRSKRGTRVLFRVSTNTDRALSDIFRKHAVDPRAPGFDRSEVRVRLYALGAMFISRSQARRLLAGLDKFRSVVLDFAGVDTIGQGFADEVFRVFRQQHADIEVTAVNMNEVVRFMVERAAGR